MHEQRSQQQHIATARRTRRELLDAQGRKRILVRTEQTSLSRLAALFNQVYVRSRAFRGVKT